MECAERAEYDKVKQTLNDTNKKLFVLKSSLLELLAGSFLAALSNSVTFFFSVCLQCSSCQNSAAGEEF